MKNSIIQILELQNQLFQNQLKILVEESVKSELEFYRNYEKSFARDGSAEFNPTSSRTCFMGRAFIVSDLFTDKKLTTYRKEVGVYPHPIWGNSTLMEIWAGEHFNHKESRQMVIDAYEYGAGITDTAPDISVNVNVFEYSEEKNSQSKDVEESRELMEIGVAMRMGVTYERYLELKEEQSKGN